MSLGDFETHDSAAMNGWYDPEPICPTCNEAVPVLTDTGVCDRCAEADTIFDEGDDDGPTDD